MAGELIGALRVALGLDSAKFEEGMKKSRARAQSDSKAIQKSLDGIKGRMDAVAGGLGLRELYQAGKRALDYASSLGEVAQQLGVNTKELQEYRYAASQAGITQDEMDKSLAKLTRTMGEAKAGGKAQVAAFKELGTAVEGAVVAGKSAGEVIPLLADALSKIKDPATRARLEVELFGKAGQKLDTLLAGGSVGVNKLREEARKLGVVLSDRQIQDADDTADKLSALKQVLEANIAGAVANNAKAILGLAEALATLSAEAVKLAGEYPRATGALAGAAVGARFGVPGAALGAGAGTVIGGLAAGAADDQNMDIRFRQTQLRAAEAEFRKRQSDANDVGGIFSVRKTNSPRSGATVASAFAEWKRQVALAQAAVAASKGGGTPAATAGDGALPTVATKAKKARGPTAADRAENFQQELSDLQGEQLGLQQNITADVRDRAMMEHQRIETERQAYNFDLDTKVRAGQMNAADAERLKLVHDRNSALKDTAVNWQLDDELTREETNVRRESLQTQIDLLGDQSRLARTTAERRDIELKILDHQVELERLSLEAVIAAHSATQAEKDIAAARLAQLGNLRAGAAAGIEKSNMGPLAAYMDSLPKNAAEVNEAFEHIAANGVANMVDGLAEASANVLKLKGVAGQLFNQLIADMMKLQMQQALGGSGGILGAIGKLFGSAASLTGMGPIFSQNNAFMDQMVSQPIKLPGFATGGSFKIGGRGGIDMNVLSLNGAPIARVSQGERIAIDPDKVANSGGGGGRLTIDPSPLFDVVMEQRAQAVAGPIGVRAAQGGASLAQESLTRRGRNRIPGR